ncbi:MAG: hypothetical protein ACLP9L_07675 [Thermoguttaceae bacterium]
MRGTIWLTALGCGILLSSSGCCGFLRDGGCGCESCGRCEDGCGPTCGPVRRPHRERIYGDDCGECSNCGARVSSGGDGNCNACGDECGGCCQRNFCFQPLRWVGRLFYADTWCGPSCGNTYWGEAISDPPDCHDPCNRRGQWTGRGGCASCNRGGMHESGEMSPVPDGAPLQDEPVMEPTPAPKAPTKATRRPPTDNYDR